ncbi:UNVERIFIED_CONTAM: hypothetical protein PYX00_010274 [Menopon gallinae]|uniref:Cationic amino acid transporter C-terminal domain-containing protein n=1 Tax=Menopon gallinae TaxID=328185 RepID=A0AAW2HEZ4_9NEOP
MTSRLINCLTRLKRQGEEDLKKTELARVLSTLDLTLLGVGSTMGVGVYVLAGQVSKDFAGPAVIISFLIAAIASIFAGFCYAEFGARVPRAGSAYAYCYFTVGEFLAFIIGWNLILEYIIGAASVTKGLSSYIDELIGGHISKFLRELCPIDITFFGEYPDFFAFAIVLVTSVGLAFGMKESSLMNNICTGLNLSVVLFVIIAGSLKADIKNWYIRKEDIPEGVNGGEGGFTPFGILGIIKGAAICFYGFIGFDCIATTGEEAKTPQKSIPLAVIGSLTIIFLAYFSMSTVLTLMVPYYDQNPNAPFTVAFDRLGWDFAKWIVSIGAVFGLFPSLLGSLIPLPRIIYAMAADGLLFRYLGRVNDRFHSPMVGTIISGFLTGLMALFFNLAQLVDMMSIGTLIAYTIVAACVLMLRYRKTEEDGTEHETEGGRSSIVKLKSQIFNSDGLKRPTAYSSALVTWMVLLFCVLCLAIMSMVAFFAEELGKGHVFITVSFGVLSILAIVIVISIGMQPKSKTRPFFMVPLVPVIPCVSIFINFYLALMLDIATWLRFGVWIIVGILIYFTYGIWHSVERTKQIAGSEMTVATDLTETCKKK